MRYSTKFRNLSFKWLVFGEGKIPPPWPWRIMAWVFLVSGVALYLLALFLLFRGSIAWAFGAGFVGYILRRQVNVVAPDLLVRFDQEIWEVGPEQDSQIEFDP